MKIKMVDEELMITQFLVKPSYSKVLIAIGSTKGNFSTIVKYVKLPKSSVHNIIKRLVREGLVIESKGIDARMRFYKLTEKGEIIYKAILRRITGKSGRLSKTDIITVLDKIKSECI